MCCLSRIRVGSRDKKSTLFGYRAYAGVYFLGLGFMQAVLVDKYRNNNINYNSLDV